MVYSSTFQCSSIKEFLFCSCSFPTHTCAHPSNRREEEKKQPSYPNPPFPSSGDMSRPFVAQKRQVDDQKEARMVILIGRNKKPRKLFDVRFDKGHGSFLDAAGYQTLGGL